MFEINKILKLTKLVSSYILMFHKEKKKNRWKLLVHLYLYLTILFVLFGFVL